MGKRAAGFSLVELMVVVGVLGILVALAVPRYQAFVVRGHRAEARVNLGQLATLQGVYRGQHLKYASMWNVGYAGSGVSDCGAHHFDNALGFQLNECENSRYGYTVSGDAAQFTAVAYAPSDADGRWVYGDCSGRGATQHGKYQGDVLVATHKLDMQVCRNIINYCPDPNQSGNVASNCGIPPPSVPPPVAPPPPPPPILPPPVCENSCASACGAWTYDSWSAWSPATSSECAGVRFAQARSRDMNRTCSNLCAGVTCPLVDTEAEDQIAIGSKPCGTTPPPCNNSCATACTSWTYNSWSAWLPSTASRCIGTSFTQTRTRSKRRPCSNLCAGVSCASIATDRPNRPATGIQPCATPTPTPTPDSSGVGVGVGGGGCPAGREQVSVQVEDCTGGTCRMVWKINCISPLNHSNDRGNPTYWEIQAAQHAGECSVCAHHESGGCRQECGGNFVVCATSHCDRTVLNRPTLPTPTTTPTYSPPVTCGECYNNGGRWQKTCISRMTDSEGSNYNYYPTCGPSATPTTTPTTTPSCRTVTETTCVEYYRIKGSCREYSCEEYFRTRGSCREYNCEEYYRTRGSCREYNCEEYYRTRGSCRERRNGSCVSWNWVNGSCKTRGSTCSSWNWINGSCKTRGSTCSSWNWINGGCKRRGSTCGSWNWINGSCKRTTETSRQVCS